MRTILVIGGAGYVGSHCCKAFANAGWNVVTYDNLSRGWRDLVRWGPLIEGDILDSGTLQAAFNEVQPDVVAHLAALTYVGESVANPALYYRTNVVGTMTVLDSMRHTGIDRLVFSSTAAVYGQPCADILDEDHPKVPLNPYGATKLAVERMLRDYGDAFGLRSTSLRYFNAAGADGDGDTGERHEPETHLIPLAAQHLLGQTPAFTINGNDFETRDGTAVRDYVHVTDIGRAHVAAANYLIEGGRTASVNLGSGQGLTILEILMELERVSGRRVSTTFGPRRAGDPASLVASNALAAEILGWTPRCSNISDILRTAWAWHLAESAKPLSST